MTEIAVHRRTCRVAHPTSRTQEGRAYSQLTQMRPSSKQAAAGSPCPPCFGSASAQATGESVSIVKWDEHGARSLRVSRERSRHGGDSAARWVVTLPAIRLRQIRVARACLGTSPRSRGGRSTAGGCTSALQRLGCGAKRPGTLARRQHAACEGRFRATDLNLGPVAVVGGVNVA